MKGNKKYSMGLDRSKMAPQACFDLGEIPNPSPGMTSSHARGLAFHDRRIGWQTGVWNNIITGGPIEKLKVAKDGPGQCLPDANDAKNPNPHGVTGNLLRRLYIVVPTRAGGCQRVAVSKYAPVKKQEEQEAGHTIHCE